MKKHKGKWKSVGQQFAPIFRCTRVGQQIIGVYIESRTGDSKKYKGTKTTFHEIDVHSGTYGLKAGKVSLVGGAQLNWLIDKAKLGGGELVRITYTGKAAKSKKWKKGLEPHQFTLEVQE